MVKFFTLNTIKLSERQMQLTGLTALKSAINSLKVMGTYQRELHNAGHRTGPTCT